MLLNRLGGSNCGQVRSSLIVDVIAELQEMPLGRATERQPRRTPTAAVRLIGSQDASAIVAAVQRRSLQPDQLSG
jgi:hypothetical protein